MCGILGAINLNGKPIDGPALQKASRLMRHRGPDDEGLWVRDNVGLAHQRLSILDLSSAGRQPMATSDGDTLIIYNGECYNFKELRRDLEARGCRFRSHTDTEVILYGVREYGPEFVKRMNGMFAFGIWFVKDKKLILARDRLGVKPLYIYRDKEKFYFASEVKPLLSLGVAARLDATMVSSFFSLRYCPGEKTLLHGIRKLAAGHYLEINLGGTRPDGEIKETCYWDLLDSNTVEPMSEAKASEEFLRIFTDAVKLRQIADVPVGAFLSGGIDSSAIVSLMRENTEKVETFTIAMGADIDESQAARRVAEHLGVANASIALGASDYTLYEKTVCALEEPIGDSIIVPTYLLARRAAQNVKVVQLGEGADEILGGYVHQLAMTYTEILSRRLPSPVFGLIPATARRLPQSLWDKAFPYPAALGVRGRDKFLDYLSLARDPARGYLSLANVFSEEEKQVIFARDFYETYVRMSDPALLWSRFWHKTKNPVFQNKLLSLDLKFWNADYTLLRMDKLTMAHSLEARVPYLDYRLVEFCLKLSRRLKTRNFLEKVLLRSAMARTKLLPKDVLAARKKAFYLPVEKCFDKGFEDFVRAVLSSENLSKRGIYNVAALQKLLAANDKDLIANKQVMLVVIFELWARLFLDGSWQRKESL